MCVCMCVCVCVCVFGPHQCINVDVPADLPWHNTQLPQVQALSPAVGTLQQLAQMRAKFLSCSPLKLRRGQSRTEQMGKKVLKPRILLSSAAYKSAGTCP